MKSSLLVAGGREREGDGDRQRQRQRPRARDRERERKGDGDREKQRERARASDRESERHIETERQREKEGGGERTPYGLLSTPGSLFTLSAEIVRCGGQLHPIFGFLKLRAMPIPRNVLWGESGARCTLGASGRAWTALRLRCIIICIMVCQCL